MWSKGVKNSKEKLNTLKLAIREYLVTAEDATCKCRSNCIPKGIVVRIFFSIASPSSAVRADVTNPGTITFS
jgi:hypothetical protein